MLAALIIGWPLIGTLVTIDDDLSGGWSNPDGKNVAEWRRIWWWADLLLVRGSIVVLCFAVEEAIGGIWRPQFWVIAVAMIAVGLPLFLSGIRRYPEHIG
jgi:hypothetical protein